MSHERIPCKNPDCKYTILPATAKANDGLCAPCIGKIRQAAWEENVRQNRRTVNLYEGVTDPVEVIRIMLTTRPHDPLIIYSPAPVSSEQIFAVLSPMQQQKLAEIAADAISGEDEELGRNIGKSLATLTGANLDDMLHAWLDSGHLSPSVAFRNAGPSVRDRIIEMIAAGTDNLNHALCALAWIGDSTVVAKFGEWEASPPAWRRRLHVGLKAYALVGGWELTKGGRRNAFFDECFALEIVPEDTPASGVQLLSERPEKCPLCGDSLIHLLEIPTGDGPFQFLGFSGSSLPVLTCERCTGWGEFTFARIGPYGAANWHPANPETASESAADFEWERGPWCGKRVALRKRSAIHAVDWCMEIPATQIGGMPTWVQNEAYPKCPDCEQTMMFLAQLDNGTFPGYEGTYYAFLCGGCRVTATTYQQT
jgi:hypothetical protein